MKILTIEFCDNGRSPVDDNVVTVLAQAMPELEILRLGGMSCTSPTGVTVDALIALASRCLHLSTLRIHFQGNTLANVGQTRRQYPFPITNRFFGGEISL